MKCQENLYHRTYDIYIPGKNLNEFSINFIVNWQSYSFPFDKLPTTFNHKLEYMLISLCLKDLEEKKSLATYDEFRTKRI